AEHWLDACRGELIWCTAASGWSKSARNAFIAPWLRGAAALLHDARFDADDRLAILAQAPVAVLCMAPTEHRGSAKPPHPTPPATVPTFFGGYLGEPAPSGPWRTGDRVTQDEEGFLFFESRTDDVIISAGYRIGPFEVESALVAHPAVAEAAVVAAPDDERGAVVRAVVVLRDGREPPEALARELQEHVKAQTAPYKYPRIVEFAEE